MRWARQVRVHARTRRLLLYRDPTFHGEALKTLKRDIALNRYEVDSGADAFDLVTGGGEDYELLATLPPDRLEEAAAAVAATGSDLTVIGSVDSGAGVELSGPGGESRPVGGFDQLRGRTAPPDRS